jgi:hypothetical protein
VTGLWVAFHRLVKRKLDGLEDGRIDFVGLVLAVRRMSTPLYWEARVHLTNPDGTLVMVQWR